MAATGATLIVLLRWCWRWGNAIQNRTGQVLDIGAAPFVGRWRHAPAHALVLPLTVGAIGVLIGPALARARRWETVVAGAAVGWVAWVGALALVDGRAAVTASLRSRYDYLAAVPRVGSPGRFLAHFAASLGSYPTHVRGHPPGTVLLLWALDRVGLGGAGGALALCLLGGAAMVAGVLVASRSLSGENWARRAAPFLMLAPSAVIATNLDLLYAGLAAWALAFAALSTESARTSRSRLVTAGASGLALGAAMLGSYGMAPMIVPITAICLVRRRLDRLAVVGVAASAVVAAPVLWGFWWLDGLSRTRHQYWAGLASQRPAGYFAVADVVVLSTVLGPLVLVAIGALALRPAALPAALSAAIAGVAGAVTIALASQMSKGEVERIWQPFMPWFVLAVPVLFAGDRRIPRPWLAVQVATGLVLVSVLRSPW